MTISNEELVAKAAATADTLAAAGKLNDAQSDAFIDYVIDETVLSGNARVHKFRNENLEIDKIGLGNRVALPAAEAADPGKRRGPKTSKVVLTPREIIVPFEIGDSFKELSIEGDSVEDHIIRLMAARLANDVEELYINGDLLGPARTPFDLYDEPNTTQYVKDTYMALFNGWLKLSEGAHVVDAAGQNIGLSVFGKLLRSLPTKFRRNPKALRWFGSSDTWQLYQEKFSTRQTAAGDAAAIGETPGPYGIPFVAVPLLPLQPRKVRHVTLTGTTAVSLGFAPVSNVVVTLATLGDTPATPFVNVTDYTLDAAAGTIARTGGGAISDGASVKVTFDANPQVMLTHMNNLIIGIGRDIRIEKDRDIFKRMNQYCITAKISVNFEEIDALAMLKNLGMDV